MAAEPTPKSAWTITSLLFFYMLINFADKTVVGLAAVPIMQELELTPRQFGLVGSSFFLLFSLSAILVGFAADRVAARSVILVLALSWALVQFPMVGAVGLATLLACRIFARGRRRPGLVGCGSRALQMVPRREADTADGRARPRRNIRRHTRFAGA